VCLRHPLKAGTLRLSFDDASSLVCEPHPRFEAWQVVGGHPQALVVCDPGGSLSIIDSTRVLTPDEVAESVRRLNELTGWNVELDEVTEDGRVIVKPTDQQDN
jgi:hypothetical protein